MNELTFHRKIYHQYKLTQFDKQITYIESNLLDIKLENY